MNLFIFHICHPRENGDPDLFLFYWIPSQAGNDMEYLLLLVYFIRAAADEVVGELAELAIVVA